MLLTLQPRLPCCCNCAVTVLPAENGTERLSQPRSVPSSWALWPDASWDLSCSSVSSSISGWVKNSNIPSTSTHSITYGGQFTCSLGSSSLLFLYCVLCHHAGLCRSGRLLSVPVVFPPVVWPIYQSSASWSRMIAHVIQVMAFPMTAAAIIAKVLQS